MARRASVRKVKEFVKEKLAQEYSAGTPKNQIRKKVLEAAKAEFGEGAIDIALILQLIMLFLEFLKK